MAFRNLAAGAGPDYRSIARFRDAVETAGCAAADTARPKDETQANFTARPVCRHVRRSQTPPISRRAPPDFSNTP